MHGGVYGDAGRVQDEFRRLHLARTLWVRAGAAHPDPSRRVPAAVRGLSRPLSLSRSSSVDCVLFPSLCPLYLPLSPALPFIKDRALFDPCSPCALPLSLRHTQYLPKLVFPYPTQWNPYPGAKPRGLTDTTITICNWSGHSYWYSTGDSTDEAWKHGNSTMPRCDPCGVCSQARSDLDCACGGALDCACGGAPGAASTLVKPLGKGSSKCVVINTDELSWRRGYVAPCGGGETDCARASAQEVHAGVNVVNAQKAGQALCTVECLAETDVCRTTTVVFISPAKCDKVHVATM